MTISSFSAGTKAKASEVNNNFNIINYKKFKIIDFELADATTNTSYVTMRSENINISEYCTGFIMHLGLSHQQTNTSTGGYYKITLTLSDASTVNFLTETQVYISPGGSSGSSIYIRKHSYTAPEGLYITNILVEGKVTTNVTHFQGYSMNQSVAASGNVYLLSLPSYLIKICEA